MRKRWLFPLIILWTTCVTAQTRHFGQRQISDVATSTPVTLTFHELFDDSGTALMPSARTRRLIGKRIRIVGFMAQMENSLKGAFYLCTRPVFCDESGNGTGDLPVDAIYIVVPWNQENKIRFAPQPFEVSGVLEFGAFTDANGNVAAFRIVAEGQNAGSSRKSHRVGKVRKSP
jgi:hypothetical protein